MMKKMYAALFDLDGVVVDTESEYSLIWKEIGKRYCPDVENFENIIKGTSLRQIFDRYFPDASTHEDIKSFLYRQESKMQYRFIAGASEFIADLHNAGVRTAIVTSSNDVKMQFLYARHSDIRQWFDVVVTADHITQSKPHPECYLLAAEKLRIPPSRCFVFEDSVAGVAAGKAAGMTVVGLSTTFPAESIAACSDAVIPDFKSFTYKKMIAVLEKNT